MLTHGIGVVIHPHTTFAKHFHDELSKQVALYSSLCTYQPQCCQTLALNQGHISCKGNILPPRY